MISFRLRRPRHPVHLLRQVAAGLLALAALVLALRPPPAPATVPDRGDLRPVVVAVADLPAGTALTAVDLAIHQLPAAAIPDGTVADPGGLVGGTLAAPVRRGEPVSDVRLVGPGLWAAVPAGQVAAPVRLADLAVAALVRPGDRVDVLAARSSGEVDVVAADAVVLAAGGGGSAGSADGAGLLLLAVSADTAAGLATASTSATLTVTLGRP